MNNLRILLLSLSLLVFFQGNDLLAQVGMKGGQEKEEIKADPGFIMPARQVTLLYEVPEGDTEKVFPGTNQFGEEEERSESQNQITSAEDRLSQSSFQVKVLVRVYSIANLAKIHVRIGSQPGSADFASHSFVFDEKTSNDPFTFVRSGKTIVLGMGTVTGIPNYHAEVIMESKSGQKSEPMYFGLTD